MKTEWKKENKRRNEENEMYLFSVNETNSTTQYIFLSVHSFLIECNENVLCARNAHDDDTTKKWGEYWIKHNDSSSSSGKQIRSEHKNIVLFVSFLLY